MSSENKCVHGNSSSTRETGETRAKRTSSKNKSFHGKSNISYLVVTGRLDAILNVRHGSVVIIHTLPLCSPLIPCGHMAHLPSVELKVYVH